MRHGFVIVGASVDVEGVNEHVQSLVRSLRVVGAAAPPARGVPLESLTAEPARTG